MSKDHWDAILASAPLNATAGAVTGKGVGFEPGVVNTEHSWDTPPPMGRIGPNHRANAVGGFIDLTGTTSGRLRVLGIAVGYHGLWVCRCACGRYVGRKAKSLKTGATQMCNTCAYNAVLRFYGSGGEAKKRAEAPEARKWKADDEAAA